MSKQQAQTPLERMYTTVDGLEAIYKTVHESPDNPAAPSFYLASGILAYAGKKSVALRDGLKEIICFLKSKSFLTPNEAENTQACFDEIFIEVAALCFAFLLGKYLSESSDTTDADYVNALRAALSNADGMLTYLSVPQKPVQYLTRRVYSYADAERRTPAFDMFNRRILRSILPGKEPALQLASAILTPHMQAAFANLNPDQLEAMSRGLYANCDRLGVS